MAKKKAPGYMTSGEKLAGTIFFVIYLVVLPFAMTPLFDLIEKLLEADISASLRSALCYYSCFAAAVLIFRHFMANTSRRFMDNLSVCCQTVVVGIVAMYGLNELVYRLTRILIGNQTNLNDMTVSAQIQGAPRTTLLIVIFLAPFVEEVLFRGLVFGCLKGKSRTVAYLLSCGLFALLHVWQFAVVHKDITYFLLMVQYMVPGAVLAWSYDRSGSLWTPIGLHAVVNALATWAMWA